LGGWKVLTECSEVYENTKRRPCRPGNSIIDMPSPPSSLPGRVAFVGAGPGAADLLTLRAVDRLRAADVIVHDSLVPDRVLDEVNPAAERIQVDRDQDQRPSPGTATGRLLARLVLEGRTVVRLKGGDPTVFARLTEELEPLRQAGVTVEFVPGITAALAAAAAAAVPLTSRDAASSVTLVTGREADGKADGIDFRSLADLPGTLAVYMGVEQVARWSRELLAAGLPADTPVTIVSRCSWPDQRIGGSTLGDCARDFETHGWRSPAVVLVGAKVPPASGPLLGQFVLATRPAGQEGELAAAIRAAGGECINVPLVRIADPPSWHPLDESIGRADTYDWIVFASGNGVRGFMRRLAALGLDGRALGTARLAAIGPATRRELEAAGYRCDLVPQTFSSEGLVAALAARTIRGRYLLVRADRGRDVLRRDLESHGHHVDEAVAYESLSVESLDSDTLAGLDATSVTWLTLTSPSVADAAVRLFGPRLRSWKIATISPLTSAALARYGLQPAAEAVEATATGLVDAIVRHGPAGVRLSEESAKAANLPPTSRG
jgi:uroporphyrinogen III methyltransferase/synthase